MTATQPLEGLDELAAELTGTVLERGADGFAAELATFNSSLLHTPQIAVCAETVEDVRAAARYASAHDLPFGVHSTGHGYTSFTEGVMVSLSRLDMLTLDPERHTVTVGPGVRWRDVIQAAAPHGLAPLTGSSPGVGVIGYSLGGGIAIMGRAFGFGTDRVRSIDLVTMDGQLHQVDPDTEPDLFWGLCGGGGNLGVVTSMTIELVELSSMYGGGIFFDGGQIADILPAYVSWTNSLPDEMCTSLALTWMPPSPDVPEPLRGRVVAHMRVCYLGSEEDGDQLLTSMRAVAPALLDHIAMIPTTEVGAIYGDPPEPVPFYSRGTLLREIPEDAIDTLLNHVGPDVEIPMLLWDLRHQEGAFGREPERPNAIGDRGAAFNLQVVGLAIPDCIDAVKGVVDKSIEALERWSTGRTLVNLHGAVKDDADRARAFDSAGYDRLVGLVRAHDPQGLLRHGHSVARSAGKA